MSQRVENRKIASQIRLLKCSVASPSVRFFFCAKVPIFSISVNDVVSGLKPFDFICFCGAAFMPCLCTDASKISVRVCVRACQIGDCSVDYVSDVFDRVTSLLMK